MSAKKLPKRTEKKIEEMKKQDRELEKLPEVKEEKSKLKRFGALFRKLIPRKKINYEKKVKAKHKETKRWKNR
ncbi:hypothetical protein ACFL0V_00030 [Nanoarchaeota archaeon]